MRRWLEALLLVVIAALATFHVPITHPAEDAFHEGEYMSAWVLPFAAEQGVFPRLIHGGMDHIPARITTATCDVAGQIVCVRRANVLLTFVSSALFLLVASLILQPLPPAMRAVAMLPAISLVLLVNGGAANTVELQQGSPAVRDAFVVATLLPLVAWCRSQEASPWPSKSSWMLLAAGFIAAVGWFWAYNRGTVAVIAVGVAATGAAVLLRDKRGPLAACIGLALGLLLSQATGVYGSVAANFDNLAYWVRHRDLYATPITVLSAFFLGPAILLFGASLVAGAAVVWRASRRGHPSDALLVGVLSIVAILYAVQTVARPDRPHVAWALWPVMLLVTALVARGLRSQVRAQRMAAIVGIMAAVITANSCSPAGAAGPRAAIARILAAPSQTAAPSPRDSDLANPGLVAAAGAIRAAAPACTLAMTNEGLLYLLAATPPCSRFAFPIHIGRDHEQEVIDELERQLPPAILFDSPFWASRIDGIAQAERTPRLAAWIVTAYPHEAVLTGGYRVRFRNPPGDD